MKEQSNLRIDERRVRVAMAMKGIDSYKELADMTNMHYNSILKILATGRFSVDSAEALAVALNVNPIDLMVTEGFPAPNWAALANPLEKVVA